MKRVAGMLPGKCRLLPLEPIAKVVAIGHATKLATVVHAGKAPPSGLTLNCTPVVAEYTACTRIGVPIVCVMFTDTLATSTPLIYFLALKVAFVPCIDKKFVASTEVPKIVDSTAPTSPPGITHISTPKSFSRITPAVGRERLVAARVTVAVVVAM